MSDLGGRRGGLRRIRALFTVALVVAAVLAPGEAHAAACVTVNSNTTLTSDITDCADNGIEITKSDITLNLNGHTVDGDDDADDFGIFFTGKHDVRIKGPGTIKEFGTGIRIENSTKNLISGLTIQDNNATSSGLVITQLVKEPCVDFPDKGPKCDATATTAGTVIKDNTITLNAGSGIIVHRSNSGTQITGNSVTDNGGDGVFLGGAGGDTLPGENTPGDEVIVKVSHAKISGNTITGNAGTGIGITAGGSGRDNDDLPVGGTGNVISSNTVNDNGTRIVEESTGTGHEGGGSRDDSDEGGHGIKVAGYFKDTRILNNQTNGNGTPVTAIACGERNGAGIMVVGQLKKVKISGNTATDNAMAGVFVAGGDTELGENQGVSITNNVISGNVQNCDNDNSGIKVTGVFKGTGKLPYNVNGNDVDNNVGGGIMLSGHNKSFTVSKNSIDGNTGPSLVNGEADSAGIDIHGRALNGKILGNTSNDNTNSRTGCIEPEFFGTHNCLAHGIMIRGSVRNLLIKNNTTIDNSGVGIAIYAQDSKPVGVKGDPVPEKFDSDCPRDPATNDCLDDNFNQASNVRVVGNTANSNGFDGIQLIADVTVTDNTANNNTDDGIEHLADATARGGDATDGPHVIADGGGNTATGNGGTNCVNLGC